MPRRRIYESIEEVNETKLWSGKGLRSRFRLKGLFRKTHYSSRIRNKTLDESGSPSDKTFAESPTETKNYSFSERPFDVHNSSPSPKLVTAFKKHHSDPNCCFEKKTVRWSPILNIEGAKIFPPPLPKARARKLVSGGRSNTSPIDDLRPENLVGKFHHEMRRDDEKMNDSYLVETTRLEMRPLASSLSKADRNQKVDLRDSPQSTGNMPKERRRTSLNAVPLENLLDFEDQTSKAISNGMLRKKIRTFESIDSSIDKNDPDDQGERFSDIELLETDEHNSVESNKENPLDPEDTDSDYQEIILEKLSSLATTLVSMAPNDHEISSGLSSCLDHSCSILECGDVLHEINFKTEKETSISPLDQSWFSVNEDADSISKLSMPTTDNEFNMSLVSEPSLGLRHSDEP